MFWYLEINPYFPQLFFSILLSHLGSEWTPNPCFGKAGQEHQARLAPLPAPTAASGLVWSSTVPARLLPSQNFPHKEGFRLLKRLAVLTGATARRGIKEPLIMRRVELCGVFTSEAPAPESPWWAGFNRAEQPWPPSLPASSTHQAIALLSPPINAF